MNKQYPHINFEENQIFFLYIYIIYTCHMYTEIKATLYNLFNMKYKWMYVCSLYTQNVSTGFNENFKFCLEISEKFGEYSESRSNI
jgi:hypothetical protein